MSGLFCTTACRSAGGREVVRDQVREEVRIILGGRGNLKQAREPGRCVTYTARSNSGCYQIIKLSRDQFKKLKLSTWPNNIFTWINNTRLSSLSLGTNHQNFLFSERSSLFDKLEPLLNWRVIRVQWIQSLRNKCEEYNTWYIYA